MSIYNRTAVLHLPVTALAPSAAGLKSMISFPDSFLIKRMWVVTRVAGSQAAHKIQLTNVANTVTYAEITTGTVVANTVLSVDVPEASRSFNGGAAIALRNVVNDATANYNVHVLVAYSE